jgi:poly [ADP-ribose] polymerase
MEVIFDLDMFKSAMVDIHVDVKKMPLGAISVSQLDKGFNLLNQLQDLVKKNKLTAKDRSDIIDLSGNFYQVSIVYYVFIYYTILLLNF